jgi:hypothetical protein
VPVLHNGKTGGALELAFAKADAFHDQDVRTCQLMAGLVTETLTHTAEEEWRKGVAAERASMLEVLEKIKPQLARLANNPDAALGLSNDESAITDSALEEAQCQNCGNQLAPGEVFCGSCGNSCRCPEKTCRASGQMESEERVRAASPRLDSELTGSLIGHRPKTKTGFKDPR